MARFDAPPGLAPGTRGSWSRISTTTAPATSSPPGRAAHESLWPRRTAVSARRSGGQLPGGITAAADLDGDGRLELVVQRGDGARVVRVKGQKTYRWQAIRPRAVTATGDQRINSFGIGGEVEVRTGLHAQKQVIAAPVVHFGLGEADARRGRPHHLAERLPAVGVRPRRGLVDRREPAAQGIVPVAVRVERDAR